MRSAWIAIFAVSLATTGCDDGSPRSPTSGDSADDGGDDGDDETGGTDGNADDDDGGPGSSDPSGSPSGDDGDPSGGSDPTMADDSASGADDSGADDRGDEGGEPSDPCSGDVAEITGGGWVRASSYFSGWFSDYPAELSLDGDRSTSWFSEGIAVDGDVSTYEWYTTDDHCIDHITIYGNSENEDEDFRTGFGYESVTIIVKDSSGDTVYEETVSLEGTPDPTIDLAPDAVLGNQVILELSGHESPDCGGFSELSVLGRPTE